MECKISCHKIGGSLLALLLVVGVHVEVWAQTFSGEGDGEGDPYEIENWNHLNEVRDHLDANFILVNDLDENTDGYEDHASETANGGEGWDPIGDDTTPFTGSFDGDFYTIENLTIDRGNEDYVGLFGSTDDATISNLTLENVDISGENRVGAVAGNFDGVMSKVAVDGTVIGSDDDIGGVAGVSSGDLDQVIADVQVDGGGGGDSHTGGLVAINNGSIINSATLGDIVGPKPVGGLVGENNGSIEKTYAAGVVSSRGPGDGEGGLVGDNNDGTISDSYWNEELNDLEDGDVTAGVGVGDGSGVQGRNISDMQWPDAYDEMESLDFDNEWGANPDDNDGYPFLQWQEYDNAMNSFSATISKPDGETTAIPFEVDVEFGDDVTTFDEEGVYVENGEVESVDGSGTEWSIFINPDSPTDSKDVTIVVEAGAATTDDGDPNEESNELVITHSPYTVSMSGPGTTTADPFEVNIEFNEEVTDFESDDIEVANGEVFELTGSGTDWTARVTPDNPEEAEDVIIVISAGEVEAENGGVNEVATETVEHTPVELTLTADAETSDIPFSVNAEFSEAINDFDDNDIEVLGGEVDHLEEIDSQNWIIHVTPVAKTEEDNVTIEVQAGAATTAGGGINKADTIIVNHVPVPTEITGPEDNTTFNTPFQVTVEFDESIETLIDDSISVENGEVDEVRPVNPDREWEIDILPDEESGQVVFITVEAGAGVTENGGLSAQSDTLEVYHDSTPFEAELISVEGDSTSVSPFEVIVEFNKEVDEFDESDLDLTNVEEITEFTEDEADEYSFLVKPDDDGPVEIVLEAGSVYDLAGNALNQDAELEVEYDGSPPEVKTFEPQAEDPTNDSPIEFLLEFTKPVVNVDESTFDNALQENVDDIEVSEEDDVYTITVTPDDDGEVIIGFEVGDVEDEGGNANESQETASITYNTSAPEVEEFETDPADSTNESNIDFLIEFTEPIPDLSVEDFTFSDNLNHVSESDLETDDDINYTLSVEALADGEVEAALEIGSFEDAAGNTNSERFSASVEYNGTAPTVEIVPQEGSPTNAEDIDFEINFSEPVVEPEIDDFNLTNTTGESITNTGDDQHYILNVEPQEDGDVIVELEEGEFVDLFGNENSESASASVYSDRTPPEVDEFFAVPEGDTITNDDPIEFTLIFDEPVSGLVSSDIDFRYNVSAIDLTGSGDTYTLQVYPITDGDVEVGFENGGFEDEAGNENTDSNDRASIEFNGTAPEAEISVPEDHTVHGETTKEDPITFEIEFSEPVPDLDVGAFELTRAINPDLTKIDDENYELSVEPTSDGDVVAKLPVGTFEDEAGNTNEQEFSGYITYDGTRPAVKKFESQQGDTTSEETIVFDLEFSEPVYELEADDFVSVNGNFENPSLDGDDGDTEFELTVEVVASLVGDEGEIEVSLPEDEYEDEAGNIGQAASATVYYDSVPPEIESLELASWHTDPTASDPFTVRLEFNEEIANFDESLLDIDDGDAEGYSTSNNRVFFIEITPDVPTVEITAPEDTFVDLAGNENEDSETLIVNYDGDIPTVHFENVPEHNATNQQEFSIDVVFSDDVSSSDPDDGLNKDDITIMNAVVDEITPDSMTTTDRYTIDIIVTTAPENEIALRVDQGAVESYPDGFENQESDPLIIWFDDTDFTAEFSTDEPDPTDSPLFEVDLLFNKDAYDFDTNELDADNADIVDVDKRTDELYTVSLAPEQEGNVELILPEGVAEDRAGNENDEEVFTIYFQEDPPEVVRIEREQDIDDPTNEYPFEIEIEFSKEIVDFYEGGLEVTNASATDFETEDDITFVVEITPDEEHEKATVEVGVPEGVYQDHAGNENLADEENFSIVYNGSEVTVELSGPEHDATNADPFQVDIIFSEPVYGLELDDLFVGNGSVLALDGDDGDEEFTAHINPDNEDEVTVSIQATSGIVEDEAGNENSSSDVLEILYDVTELTAEFSTEEEDPTASGQFEVTLEFNKKVVVDFEADLVVQNGDIDNFSDQGDGEFTFDLLPDEFGMVEVTLPEDVTEDGAGNPNESAEFEIEYVPDRPQVISVEPGQNTSDPTGLDPFYINIEFDRDISAFNEDGINDADGIQVDNGVVVDGGKIVEGNDRLFEVAISPNGEGEVTIEEIPQGVAVTDGIENELWEEGFTIYYDPNRPFVEDIERADGISEGPTGDYPFQVEIVFNKEIANFTDARLELSGEHIETGETLDPTATGFQTEDNTTFIVDITPENLDDRVEIEVYVPANVYEDLAGNENEADVENFTIIYDGQAPQVVEFDGPEHNATTQETFDVDIVFDQEVEEFDRDLITVEGGELNDLEPSSSFDDRITAVINVDRGTNNDEEQVDLSMRVEHDAFRNDNGFGNIESGLYEASYDVVPLTIDITSSEGNSTNADNSEITIEFNKEVIDFEQSDLQVGNGQTYGWQEEEEDRIFTFTLEPIDDGLTTIYLEEGVTEDAAGHKSPETLFEIEFNRSRPYVEEFYPIPGDPTNEELIEFAVEMSEPVENLNLDDFNITGGDADKVSLDGEDGDDYFVFTVEAGSEGLIEVNLPENRYRDEAGNMNNSTATSSVVYDITRPVVDDIRPAVGFGNPTNENPFEVEIEFSKEITDFDVSQLEITGDPHEAEATGFETDDDVTFTVEITTSEPDDDSEISVEVPVDVFTDLAGNLNEEDDEEFTIEYRGTPPVVEELIGPEHETTNENPFDITVIFSEEVTGLDTGGFEIENGSAVSFTEDGSPDRYTVGIEPDQGDSVEVIISVLEGAAENEAGNDNEASEELNVVYDVTPFTVEITSEEDDPTSAESIEITLNFNKPVYDLSLDDFEVENVTAGNLQSQNDQEYTVDIDPESDGDVFVSLPDQDADTPPVDAAGNELEFEEFEIESNQERPFVETFEPVQDDPTNEPRIEFEIKFSEPVEDLELGDFEAENASRFNLTGSGDTYVLTVDAHVEGTVEVTLPDDTYEDAAGNRNEDNNTSEIFYDTTPPEVTEFYALENPSAISEIEFRVRFNKNVEDLDADDFVSDDANMVELDGEDDEYLLTITAHEGGEIEVTLPEGAAQDAAGNSNEEPATAVVTFDDTAPRVIEFDPVPGEYTNDPEIQFELTFSEPITDLDQGDFVITEGNASIEDLDEIDAENWVLSIKADDEGLIEVNLPADSYEDMAGNINIEGATGTVVYDTSPFTVEITSDEEESTNEEEFEVRITFNKTVYDFEESDLELTNASSDNFEQVDETEFTVDIYPEQIGDVVVEIEEGVTEDAAGNPNEPHQFEIYFNNSVPEVVEFEPVPESPTNENPIEFELTFNMVIEDLDAGVFEVDNGEATEVNGSDSTYTLTVEPDGDGLVEVELPEESFENEFGTWNEEPAHSSITYNGTRPVVDRIEAVDGTGNPTNDDPFEIEIEFSEVIVDFDESELTISNDAEAVDFTTEDDKTFIVAISPDDPDAQQTIEVNVPDAVYHDEAGNPNEADNLGFSIDFDNAAPTVVLIGPEYNSTNQDPFEVEIIFSKPVDAPEPSDIFILNGEVLEVEEDGSPDRYIATIEPADGDDLIVRIQLNEGAVQDEAGNSNESSDPLSVRYDTTPLTAEIFSEEEEPTYNSPFEVTVQFNKEVLDFEVSDLVYENIASVEFEDEGDGEFILTVEPDTYGDVKIELPDGNVEDPAGNPNETVDPFEIEFAPQPPEVVRVEAGEDIDDPTNVNPFQVEIEFSLDISIFQEDELILENASVSDWNTEDDRTFVVDIAPDEDGEVTLEVPEGTAYTGAGAKSLAYDEIFTITYDGTRPQISFDTEEDDPVRSPEFTVSIMFTDRVFDFNESDLQVDNADIVNFTEAERDSFSVRLAPVTDGLVTVTIPENVTTDAAGNTNEEGEFSITYNSTPPSVVLVSPEDESGDIPVETEFSWESASRAEVYHLQVSRYEEFEEDDIVKEIDDIEETAYEVSEDLDFERTYFWRVRGINSEGNAGEWSEEWTFTTVKELPPQVQLDFPEDGQEDVQLQPDLSWFSANRAESYDIQISHDASFNNTYIEESGVSSTEFTPEENLNDDETYFWRVRATNDAGAGEWSETFSFETILRPPGEVVLETPTDSTGSVQLDPMLAWSSAERAEHYVIEIAEEGNFDQPVMVLEDVEDVEVAVNDELDWFTIYDWRVRAVNESDAGEWSDVGTFVSKAEPPELLFPEPGAVDISSAPAISWTSNHNGVEFEYMIFDDDELQSVVNDGNTDTTAVVVTGLEDAKTHYWQVRVVDELTTSDWSDTKVFSTRSDPGGQEFSKTTRFTAPGDDGANMLPEDSRLIGLPGSENFVLDEIIEGLYHQDWRAFHDTGEEEDYFVEFEADNDSLEFGDGAAYWVIHRDAVSVDDEIRPVLPTEIDTYPIELHPGWNIITNPFFDSVDWNLVKAFNIQGLEEYGVEGIPADFNELQLFGYSSLFIEEEVMRPMEGYYFYNNPEWELEELHIPFTDFEARGLTEPEIEDMLTDPEASRIALEARWAGDDQDNEESSGSQFITSVDMVFSSDNPERFNSPYPSLQQSHYGMAINSGDAGKRSSLRRTTGSVYNEEGTEYEVDVKAPVGETLTWSADFEEMSDQARLMIVNPVTRKSYIFDNGDEIEIDVTEPEVTYTVYVGDEAYIKEIEENLLPDQVTLKDNYPNPFNPTTTIRYALVEEENVRIEVFDILGRRVQTLVDNEQQSAGWYTVEFDGSALASGTYIYRLVAGNEIKTGKMMLVK